MRLDALSRNLPAALLKTLGYAAETDPSSPLLFPPLYGKTTASAGKRRDREGDRLKEKKVKEEKRPGAFSREEI